MFCPGDLQVTLLGESGPQLILSVQEAVTSNSRRSAKKRAKEARRWAAQAGHPTTQPADDISDGDGSDEQEQDSVAKSAYEVAREQKHEERIAEELAEAEAIKLAHVRTTQRLARLIYSWLWVTLISAVSIIPSYDLNIVFLLLASQGVAASVRASACCACICALRDWKSMCRLIF